MSKKSRTRAANQWELILLRAQRIGCPDAIEVAETLVLFHSRNDTNAPKLRQ